MVDILCRDVAILKSIEFFTVMYGTLIWQTLFLKQCIKFIKLKQCIKQCTMLFKSFFTDLAIINYLHGVEYRSHF